MSASEYQYTGVLTEDMEIVYCDAPEIFHKLLDRREKLRRKASDTAGSDCFYYSFSRGGICYRAKLERMRDKKYLCRISDSAPPDLPDPNELIADLSPVTGSLLSMMTAAQMVTTYIGRTDFRSAEETSKTQEKQFAGLIARLYDIMFLLSTDKEAKYIQLRKWLIHSADVISIAVGSAVNRISLSFNVPGYVNIDYSAFELALFNLARIAFLCCCEGSVASLGISGRGNMITVDFNAPFQQNCGLDVYSVEMRAVKHFFSLWGGRFDFCEQYGMLYGTGYFMAEFLSGSDKLDSGYIISLSGSVQEIMERRRKSANRKLYFVPEREIFRSMGRSFDDAEDRELQFAKLFFSGINPDG